MVIVWIRVMVWVFCLAMGMDLVVEGEHCSSLWSDKIVQLCIVMD
jgi:hypothetical protein